MSSRLIALSFWLSWLNDDRSHVNHPCLFVQENQSTMAQEEFGIINIFGGDLEKESML
jgi:hypothetical protein